MDNYVLDLMQLCDSNFPTGAFNHSFGLETYIQGDHISNQHTFSSWIKAYLQEQLVYTDGLACALSYEALKNKRMEDIWQLDSLITVQNLPAETRDANMKMGERLLKMTIPLYEFQSLIIYSHKIETKQAFGHPAIVFAMIGYGLNIPKQSIVLAYLYSTVAGLVQNAVRGIPIGQTAGQTLLHDLQTDLASAVRQIDRLSIDDFGITAPGLELSQMNHEQLNIRIFMS
ncbi:urease accessory protein UreF [Barrientosiimonas marina]|uniref:Urease accessory protein UreF n=1 Tax=Lentibacillus kimchii TaxID=1542911 RepID=A0ABW2UQ55_9BACI